MELQLIFLLLLVQRRPHVLDQYYREHSREKFDQEGEGGRIQHQLSGNGHPGDEEIKPTFSTSSFRSHTCELGKLLL